ncbi:MAG TPA: cytochrome c [Pseudolabrys sp.]|nr:cytochrome c [Pseudolabrys sp.]
MLIGSRQVLALAVSAAVFCLAAIPARAADAAQIARGKYLVSLGGCNDCHTPGYFFGRPDTARYLGGSDVGFAIPHLGVFVGPNLTPDKETGLGRWTVAQIIAAFTHGTTPQGRALAPIMPWLAFGHLRAGDATAVALYLKSLPPVRHAVPGPFRPGKRVTVPVMTVLPADLYNKLQRPAAPSKSD